MCIHNIEQLYFIDFKSKSAVFSERNFDFVKYKGDTFEALVVDVPEKINRVNGLSADFYLLNLDKLRSLNVTVEDYLTVFGIERAWVYDESCLKLLLGNDALIVHSYRYCIEYLTYRYNFKLDDNKNAIIHWFAIPKPWTFIPLNLEANFCYELSKAFYYYKYYNRFTKPGILSEAMLDENYFDFIIDASKLWWKYAMLTPSYKIIYDEATSLQKNFIENFMLLVNRTMTARINLNYFQEYVRNSVNHSLVLDFRFNNMCFTYNYKSISVRVIDGLTYFIKYHDGAQLCTLPLIRPLSLDKKYSIEVYGKLKTDLSRLFIGMCTSLNQEQTKILYVPALHGNEEPILALWKSTFSVDKDGLDTLYFTPKELVGDGAYLAIASITIKEL